MSWLSAGHNGWFSINVSESKFKLTIKRKAVNLENNFDKVASTAIKILKEEWSDKPLFLAMSGGIDSELVARTLFQNQIPFTPIILKIGTVNQIESWYAEYWCQQHNVTPLVLNYTLEEYATELAKFFPKLLTVKNYNLTPILILYKYVYDAGGYCIYSAGDINLKNSQFFCNSLDFVSNIVDVGQHPTSFFMYTPELALSYVNQFDVELSEQYNKLKFYKVSPRPKIDYLTTLHSTPVVKEVLNKLNYIFKIDNVSFDPTHWYGTKTQLMHDLLDK